MGKNKFDKDVMVCAVQGCLDGKYSQLAIANRLGINDKTFQQCAKNYQAMGAYHRPVSYTHLTLPTIA